MRLVIVIPTLDEEEVLAARLREVRPEADLVVVSDGGSRDCTVAVAESAGVAVTTGPPGRGIQLNRGAAMAIEEGAEGLLFLHADTRLPAGAGQLVRDCLTRDSVGGAFFARFDDPRAAFRLGSRLVDLRTRLTRIPLGDQAQFVRTDVFRELGGFPDWPILEDLDFARRLRRHGRLTLLRPPVLTSPRRYAARGILRTVTTNWLIWSLFAVGVSPERLARLYRKVR